MESEPLSNSLTLLTVNFRSAELVRRNVERSFALNPGFSLSWVIVDNEDGEPSGLSQLADLYPGQVKVVQGPPPCIGMADNGSYHHAAGIAVGLPLVQTRYLAVVDPDFFVLAESWAMRLTEHMRRQGLLFFGAPWDPALVTKIRGFPCAHFFVTDLASVSKEALDFRPDLSPPSWLRRAVVARHTNAHQKTFWFPWLHLLRLTLDVRSSRDTGYRIYRKMNSRAKGRVELLKFVLHKEGYRRWWIRMRECPKILHRWIHLILRIGLENAVQTSEREEDLRDRLPVPFRGTPVYWDEFQWQGQLFAVHLRRVAASARQDCPIGYDRSESWAQLLNAIVGLRGTTV